MKIFYVAGPGNVVGTFRHYLKGEHDPGQVAITYSGQFFDVCRDLGLEAKVVTTFHDGERIAADGIEVENWPCPWMRRGGARFHLGSWLHHARLVAAILASRAEVVVYSDFGHWFLLAPVRLAGVKIIPTLHNRFWAEQRPRRGIQGLICKLNGWFFGRCVSGAMAISDEIVDHVREMTDDAPPIRRFLPSYVPGTFKVAPRPVKGPKRILYVGRVEKNKGALDTVDIAATLRERGRRDLVFEICGDGGALDEMKKRVRSLGLEDFFNFRGHVGRADLPGIYRESFVVLAPTRTDFAEGFNKVVAEAVLAGRPAITSRVCPGAVELGDAVMLVPPDSVAGYADAIETLIDDPQRYDEIVEAGAARRSDFQNEEAGWGACLKGLLRDAFPELATQPSEVGATPLAGAEPPGASARRPVMASPPPARRATSTIL